jgi:hypothetical protein
MAAGKHVIARREDGRQGHGVQDHRSQVRAQHAADRAEPEGALALPTVVRRHDLPAALVENDGWHGY